MTGKFTLIKIWLQMIKSQSTPQKSLQVYNRHISLFGYAVIKLVVKEVLDFEKYQKPYKC